MTWIKPVLRFLLSILIALWGLSCYNFKGISIAPGINTFYVDQFQNSAGNAPPDIGQQISEALRDIILRSSRLTYDEVDPAIEFAGSVRGFNVRPVAPQDLGQGQFGSALNRLDIIVQVDYINHHNEEENWSQSFTFFEDYDNTQNLEDVQEQFIVNIFRQISEDIFTRAFTNW